METDPTPPVTGEITLLLSAARGGDADAMARLLPLVYDFLREQAERSLRRERSSHTLQPTALVHEAWLRLADERDAHFQDRNHFLAVAGMVMRRILVDHARYRSRQKRGGGAKVVSWERTRTLFGALLERTPADRRVMLAAESDESVRREVEALLAALDEDDGFLATPALSSAPFASALLDASDTLLGANIGGYTLLRRIGAGGMGVVYEAEQATPRRRVAVKLLRSEFAERGTLHRFRREAELLGRLQHPGIAAVHEAGVAPDPHGQPGRERPFCAMELVVGVPVTAYVDEHKLQLGERIELIAQICDAVDHAHRRGVLHRDIKPANILVTADGSPKVLDFGIARAPDAQPAATLDTAHGDIVGTLGTMSPEQLRGDREIDARSDVYSLGVLAYELLSGRPPFDVRARDVAAAFRHVLDHEPTSIGRLRRDLRGDVETVVTTAMEKDPQRRYATAAALASDLRACRDRRPIAARPPSVLYRSGRFVQRNRALVGVTTLAFAAVCTAAIWALVSLQAATRSAERSRRSNTSLIGPLEWLDPVKAGGPKADLVDALDEAERLTAELDVDPEVAYSVREVLGLRYFSVGNFEKAALHHAESLRVAEELHGPSSAQAATSLLNLGMAYRKLGQRDAAIAAQERGLAIRRDALRLRDTSLAESENALGAALFEAGRVPEAIGHFERALRVEKSRPDASPADIATGCRNLFLAYLRAGRTTESAAAAEESIAQNKLAGVDPLDDASFRTFAGTALLHGGQAELALEMYQAAYAIRSQLLPLRHADLNASRSSLANTLTLLGRPREAVPYLRDHIRYDDTPGPNPVASVGWMAGTMIKALRESGDESAAAEVERMLREATE
ncbi:MAG: ECF-type sigma factor [Phycisphaerae bacterium]|nr:ECF-type sigma factor [Phycisphaerae bacterium]